MPFFHVLLLSGAPRLSSGVFLHDVTAEPFQVSPAKPVVYLKVELIMKSLLMVALAYFTLTLITNSAVVLATDTPTMNTSIMSPSNGVLSAKIRRTPYGIPHIKANDLESLGFGSAYAQAQDHLCILADGFIKANSERSKYFGPHQAIDFSTGQIIEQDNKNLISDFAYKALRISTLAKKKYPQYSQASKALIEGFTAGYNQFLADAKMGIVTPPAPCAGQAWLKPITAIDIVTYIFSIQLLPGAGNFLDLIFFANPNNDDNYLPRPLTTIDSHEYTIINWLNILQNKLKKAARHIVVTKPNFHELASNGWGLGKQMTENGKGMLLANPHFPHTGNLRFWQSHITIPNVLDTMGGSLVGMPGIINIGFNKNIAWTHTFSQAEHLIVYRLELNQNNRKQYLVNGEIKPIFKKTYIIKVNNGNGITSLAKDIYYTEFGPMIETPANLNFLNWDDTQAFTLQDVNLANLDTIDHWLAINMAKNLTEFKQANKDYDGLIFNNTLYADQAGNSFYIDDSPVPGLSEAASQVLATSPELQQIRKQAGFTILPGNTRFFAFNRPLPYDQVPKLERQDFVQNSNESYWATNPAQLLTGFSPLYGATHSELSLRARMGLKLLRDASGNDQKFSLTELETALLSNRSYLSELIFDELIAQCLSQGNEPVIINDTLKIEIDEGCHALQQWDRRQNNHSIAGHLFREFAYQFSRQKHLTMAFDARDPANTPHTLSTDGSALQALAIAIANVNQTGWPLDARLGEIQFMEKSLPDGSPSGLRLAWSGASNQTGGFNVYANNKQKLDDTLLPQHQYPVATDVLTQQPLRSGLGKHGYHVRYGSSWMMVVSFTKNGPIARGLLTYSQSNDAFSEHYNDQSSLYSTEKRLRPLLFNEQDIVAQQISSLTLKQRKPMKSRLLNIDWLYPYIQSKYR